MTPKAESIVIRFVTDRAPATSVAAAAAVATAAQCAYAFVCLVKSINMFQSIRALYCRNSNDCCWKIENGERKRENEKQKKQRTRLRPHSYWLLLIFIHRESVVVFSVGKYDNDNNVEEFMHWIVVNVDREKEREGQTDVCRGRRWHRHCRRRM